jgi:tetratricopeptide (TPR) repeat protein
MGRFDESAYHADLAQQLDPTKINYKAVRGLHYFYEHRFDDTIAQSRMVLEQDPNAYLAYLYLSIAQAAKGHYAEGIEAGEKAGAITGGAPSDLFVIASNYAVANDRAKTDVLIDKLQSLSNQRYVDPFFLVAIYAYRGDKDRAFAYMEKSYAEKSYWMTSIKVHPVVDALRSDKRFVVMLQRMNLDD